ncbi:MAG: dTDP-4-amino-4,6-dideoxygalactose transaminase [Gammaproteobacteria bacterium]|nr:dTDP-4-amino-4,6-dideoxygalactose transaminase [Gammaproteobacteria bacterium]
MSIKIPFNKPYMTGKELFYISQAHHNMMLAGDGPFTKKCHHWLEEKTLTFKALLMHSCTAALEVSALVANIQPGDEIIMPSYTFVSTANAFVLRGGIPVFVDIRSDTMNIDESKIEQAITNKTKAIVPVHYAGVSCEMDTIMSIAEKHDLLVIEDAAQGIMSSYRGKALGTIGHIGALSFHETKNIICGEGGALLVNEDKFINRSEIIREKGTNRSQFFRGEIDKYTWCDIGSSYLTGELNAAFLWAQMEESTAITNNRLRVWDIYHQQLKVLEEMGYIIRPVVPEGCIHNAHMYYILLPNNKLRTALIAFLDGQGIHCVFHYIPLHSSPAGKNYTKISGSLEVTERTSEVILRLPLWVEMTEIQVYQVCDAIRTFFQGAKLKS